MEKVPNEDYRHKTYPCSHCGVNTVAAPKDYDPIHQIHGYKLHCMDCGNFIGWSGYKKEIIKNGERQFSSQWPAKRAGIDYCQICLRNKTSLGKTEKIETHHIIQICDGGEDELMNIMFLCTACHAFVHHQRTYLQRHLKPQAEAYRAIQVVKEKDPGVYQKFLEIYRGSKVKHDTK
ncbi:MAG: HNH endonuclease [Bacteroidota bacterium]